MDTAFHDLPADGFPATIRAFRISDDAEVWTETLDGPAVLYVPPLAAEHGPVRIRVELANGETHESSP